MNKLSRVEKLGKYHLLVLSIIMLLVLTACQTNDSKTEELTLTDYDGNTYKTVTIGDQIWLSENLRTKHYVDGSDIKYFETNGDLNNNADYGLLYDFVSVNKSDKQIAPEGWHVPTEDDWKVLINTLEGLDKAGGLMKEKSFWETTSSGEKPTSGFNARPAGMHDFTNVYQWFALSACYSSSSNSDGTDALYYFMNDNNDKLIKGNFHPNDAVSVRLIKNDN